MIQWRQVVEGKFVFDPTRAIDPRDIAQVEHHIQLERQKFEERLRSGVAELRQVHGQIFAVRQHLKSQVSSVHAAYLRAIVDYEAAKPKR